MNLLSSLYAEIKSLKEELLRLRECLSQRVLELFDAHEEMILVSAKEYRELTKLRASEEQTRKEILQKQQQEMQEMIRMMQRAKAKKLKESWEEYNEPGPYMNPVHIDIDKWSRFK